MFKLNFLPAGFCAAGKKWLGCSSRTLVSLDFDPHDKGPVFGTGGEGNYDVPALLAVVLKVSSRAASLPIVAIRKVLMAKDVPAPRPPLVQSVPDEFIPKDGEKTQ